MHLRRYMEINSNSLKSPIALVGLPGIASVGTIAIESLSQILDAQPMMDIYSTDFPPRILVQKGLTFIPKSSVLLYRAAPDEPHDLIFLTADYQPSSSGGVYEFADYVARELNSFGVKEMYALAAYEQGYEEYFSHFPNSPRIYVSASSEGLLKRVSSVNGTIITEDGSIVGANGVIPVWASTMYNMESACLLGETLGVIKADYRAAQHLLEVIINHLHMKVDLESMEPQISKVLEFIEWARSEIAQRTDSPSEDDLPSDRYIG
ncbi:MAG: PAC2 family protein [Candidatus Thorarchaeota archaeon]|nr:PAC2 family protein [Candidatus Thorarchaeota archaeon]